MSFVKKWVLGLFLVVLAIFGICWALMVRFEVVAASRVQSFFDRTVLLFTELQCIHFFSVNPNPISFAVSSFYQLAAGGITNAAQG